MNEPSSFSFGYVITKAGVNLRHSLQELTVFNAMALSRCMRGF